MDTNENDDEIIIVPSIQWDLEAQRQIMQYYVPLGIYISPLLTWQANKVDQVRNYIISYPRESPAYSVILGLYFY